MKAKVLVTGGGGFIGSHLVERLDATGFDVNVIDNFAVAGDDLVNHYYLVDLATSAKTRLGMDKNQPVMKPKLQISQIA